MPKPKASPQPEPIPDKDPAWLLLDPTSQPTPPAATRSDQLPFLELGWADFERLARRLAAAGGQVEEAWAYGTTGQAQYGIDVLVRLTDGTYEVWQTKRYQKLTATDITKAVNLFLRHPWAEKARTFVLATACPMATRTVVEKIEASRRQLATRDITFRPLDATRLTTELKDLPDIIDDFFDRPWVKRICSPEAVRSLENRFSRFDAATLRVRLRDCYRSWSTTVDPGLLIAGQDHRGQVQPAISISDRFVQPDTRTTLKSAASFSKPSCPSRLPRAFRSFSRCRTRRSPTPPRKAALARYASTVSVSMGRSPPSPMPRSWSPGKPSPPTTSRSGNANSMRSARTMSNAG